MNLRDNGYDISQLFTHLPALTSLPTPLSTNENWRDFTGGLSALNPVLGAKAKQCDGHLGGDRT